MKEIQAHPSIASTGSLVHGLRQAAALYPDNIALLDKGAQGAFTKSTTLKDFYAQAKTVAANLAALGLKEGERIGIWADNQPMWNLTDVAAAMNRCASVGFYGNDPLDALIYKINDSSARFIFVDTPKQLETLQAVAKDKIPSVKEVIFFDRAGQNPTSARPFSELLKPSSFGIEKRIDAVKGDDIAKIMYTSGTTGAPKGAMVSQRNLFMNAVNTTPSFMIYNKSTVISYLPNAHIFQALVDYVTWLNGAHLAYSNKFTMKDDLPKIRPRFLPGVPKVFKMFLQGMNALAGKFSDGKQSILAGPFDKEALAPKIKAMMGLDRIDQLLSGAAKLDTQTIEIYKDKLDLVVDEGYGISEVAGAVSIGGPRGRKLGACGRLIVGMQGKVVAEDGRELPVGETGEIALKGEMIFKGYLNKPEATAKVLKNGWYFTGDRGRIDKDGFVEVFGRSGLNVKFANGEFYDLEEIGEKFLAQARLIGQVAVAGEGREYCVGLICLAEDMIAAQGAAKAANIAFTEPRELVYHPAMVNLVRDEFARIKAASANKHPYERIDKAIYLRPFTAGNQETTPTQKLRVRYVLDKYAREIAAMYDSKDDFRVLEVS
ncbi:MAG: AMP-binding protein [Planctomycetes bacterium]|nr:AMP-binding protein [Planctomycetota bacterium]NUQ33316.1 AMP-binding protein [Planctomycetaceae bacterium]